MTSSSLDLSGLCDHDVVFSMPPADVVELLGRLARIDRQAQNVVTSAGPVNAQAVFNQLDEMKKLFARADRSGRFARLVTEDDQARAREAVAKL